MAPALIASFAVKASFTVRILLSGQRLQALPCGYSFEG